MNARLGSVGSLSAFRGLVGSVIRIGQRFGHHPDHRAGFGSGH